MSEYLKKPRSIFSIAMALAIVTMTVFFVVPRSAAVAQSGPQLTPLEAETMLLRLGLGPDRLAAVGVDGSGAETVVNDLAGELGSNLAAIRLAQTNYAVARSNHNSLQDAVRAGDTSNETLTALQTAESELASTRAALDQHLDGLYTAATDSLTSLQRSDLETIRANASHRGPVAFKVVERSESSWVDIRDALASERYANETGEPVPDGAAAFLSSIRSESDVASAQASYDLRYAEVAAACDSALGDL
jgi:hypothetical protein